MTEVSKLLFDSITLSDEPTLTRQCEALQGNFQIYFEEIAGLSVEDVITATHQARKTLKSYRAFVKLLKNCTGISNYKKTNYQLRDLGKEFSDMRDAHVRGMLLSELCQHLDSQPIHDLLKNNTTQTESKENALLSEPNHFEVLSNKINQSTLLEELLDHAEVGSACLFDSFESAFRKSSAAYSACTNQQTEDLFHEWRKRLKDLLNQIKLFKSEQELLSDDRFSLIDGLCEEMGMLNDMAMLKDWIIEIAASETENDKYAGILMFLNKKTESFQQRLIKDGKTFYKNPDQTLHSLKSMISDE